MTILQHMGALLLLWAAVCFTLQVLGQNLSVSVTYATIIALGITLLVPFV